MKALLALFLLLVVGVAVWFGVRRAEPMSPVAPTVVKPAAPTPDLPVPVAAPLPERKPAPPAQPKPGPGDIEYPGGLFYPPLNGVTVSVKQVFHPRLLPFTKIVGVERDARGRDWYLHEDGARSTVYVNAAGVATGEISKPTTSQPLLPDELPGPTADPTRK